MRPLRFLLLLSLFVALPVILTCISLFSRDKSTTVPLNVGQNTRTSRLRALFSFTTPSALFPPSVVISLTDDNSTSFLARPAAFGPSLPLRGLSGQLWVGKGFGEDGVVSEELIKFTGFELGCSDVPGWNDDHKNRPENGAVDGKSARNAVDETTGKAEAQSQSIPAKRDGKRGDGSQETKPEDDGTDDHLHHPLPDSNPASPEKPGEPASNSNQDKTKPPVHADIESLQESADIAGKVVMLSRGGCGFLEKVKWAQRRGGVAVIVGDNKPGGELINMYANGDASNITIPAIFTSYYSAHLLSTLVPSEEKFEVEANSKYVQVKDGSQKSLGSKKSDSTKETSELTPGSKGWVQNVLSAVGLEDDANAHGEDSRRPPGSGNINWVLLEDWDEDKPLHTTTGKQTQKLTKSAPLSSRTPKTFATTMTRAGDDDWVIGVQDWRDTEVIRPKPTTSILPNKQKGKVETATSQSSTSTSSVNPTATALKGGSITPGSGEYDHEKPSHNKDKQNHNKSERPKEYSDSRDRPSFRERFAAFFHGKPHRESGHQPDGYSSIHSFTVYKDNTEGNNHKDKKHQGLWVTLTPANLSTSPFFDTLLVLVVSPLVTLTFVYGLLLLRSRIRRRRWRAPKSIVERLPVRTYHTMSSTSSTTSLALTSPQPSAETSPTLRPSTHTRVRPRSQTTTGVLSSVEKSTTKSSPKRKKYVGRQVECVVCLEEYVDGESQVMSLPCGHEFHADCITPWLVTRRRTCPICKGDVVRSMARSDGDASSANSNARAESEQTSDDVQDQAAMTENTDETSAIPIPAPEDNARNTDIERGSDVETPLLGSTPRAQQNRWRGILNGSLRRLSGDTVWRSGGNSVNDRTR